MTVFHQDRLHVSASMAVVAGYILDPQRVMAYFPDAIDGGTFDDDAIWIRAKTGTTLIERVASEPGLVSVRVTSSGVKHEQPARTALGEKPLVRFYEDWRLDEQDGGTRIEKSWRDLEAFGFMKLLPMRWIVRRTANQGKEKLEAAWSQ